MSDHLKWTCRCGSVLKTKRGQKQHDRSIKHQQFERELQFRNVQIQKEWNHRYGSFIRKNVLEELFGWDISFHIFSFLDTELKTCGHSCIGNEFLMRCCICMDMRPHDDHFIIYRDGKRWEQIKRNHFYCHLCKHI